MKKLSYRFFVICITVLFMSFLLVSCGTNGSSAEEAADSVQSEKQELLAQWEKYLSATEALYSQMHWVFDEAKAFADDNSWDSLQKARAACSAVKISMQSTPAPEFTMTQEQCKKLTDAGIEVDGVRNEYLDFEAELTLQADTLNALEAMLQHDVFLTADVSIIGDWVDSNRGAMNDTSEYLCLMTNYLLLQLENTELWNRIPAEYPSIAFGYTDWSDDPSLLMENTSLVLDRYQDRFVQMEEYLGTAEYTLIIVQEAVETGNLEYLIDEIHTVSDVPTYIPVPEWMPEDAAYYYLVTDSETGEKRLVQSGEELSQVPSACYIPCNGITREQVEAYGERLQEWGLEPIMEWDEASQTYQVFVVLNQSQMLIKWTQEQTVLYLTEPIACLIPELYLVAMLNR